MVQARDGTDVRFDYVMTGWRELARSRRSDAAIDTVSGTLVNTLKGTGAVGAALTGTGSDVLRGAILGPAHVGTDIRGAAKGGVTAAMRSTWEGGVEVTESIAGGARAGVKM